jgi:hypothetical protein
MGLRGEFFRLQSTYVGQEQDQGQHRQEQGQEAKDAAPATEGATAATDAVSTAMAATQPQVGTRDEGKDEDKSEADGKDSIAKDNDKDSNGKDSNGKDSNDKDSNDKDSNGKDSSNAASATPNTATALMTREERATGNVAWSVYKYYFSAASSPGTLLLMFCALVTTQCLRQLVDVWLAVWSARRVPGFGVGQYLGVFAG